MLTSSEDLILQEPASHLGKRIKEHHDPNVNDLRCSHLISAANLSA